MICENVVSNLDNASHQFRSLPHDGRCPLHRMVHWVVVDDDA